MKAISLFSGVGGFDLGLERAGIETVLQAEIDPWCNKVLSRHWPDTRRVEDVRCVGMGSGEHHQQGESELTETRISDVARRGDVGLVYGGFPCQDLSVAGKRAGLGGERSGLWFEFHRVLSEMRPRYALVENVPGLLSSGDSADFRIILEGLGELGYGVAWRVWDAQFFLVPQRRRRVFILAVLDPEPRLGAERAAQVLSLCESCGGNPETGRAPGEGVAYSLTAGVRGTGDGHGNAWNSNYVTEAIAVRTAQAGSNGWGVNENTAYTLDGANGQAVLAASVSASAGHHGHSSPRGDGSDNLVVATYVPDVAYAIAAREAKGVGLLESQTNYIANHGVRRLTPLECERLQGWPDDWTRWAADGSEIPDSHRYRMIRNGVASPVAEWIGHRLMAVLR